LKAFLFFPLFLFLISTIHAQIPKSGAYTYKIVFAEQNGQSLGESCIVFIKGNAIKVIYNGKGKLSGTKKGDILDQGIIMKHTKTGKWIIGHSPKDKNAKEVGGCSEGPQEIDFKHRLFWMC
jgi:hypothetical protein